MTEVGLAVLVSASGVGVLAPLQGRLPRWALVSLAFPAGAGTYSIIGLGLLLTVGTVHVATALALTVAAGAAGAVVAHLRRSLGWESLFVLGLVVVGTAVVAAIAWTQHLTRLTPDSIRYLLVSSDIGLPSGLSEIQPDDLLKRQIGLPMLQTLAELGPRRYLAFVSPMFAASAVGLFVWLASHMLRDAPHRLRWSLVGAATLFVLSTNRFVYHAFYINTHMAMALFMLVAIAGIWLAIEESQPVWGILAGWAMALTLLFRPEGPIVTALILVPFAATAAPMRLRWRVVGPVLAVFAAWYVGGLWIHAPGGWDRGPVAPVLGNSVVVLAVVVLTLVGGTGRGSRWARLAGRALLPAMVGLLVTLLAIDPQLGLESLGATIRNLAPDWTWQHFTGSGGLWIFSWPVILVLLATALIVGRDGAARLWRVPIVGFGILFFILPYLRGSAYRVGFGDSGSRIATHIVLVVVAYVLLVASETIASRRETRPDRRTAVSSEPG
jgi:hypothetical protein